MTKRQFELSTLTRHLLSVFTDEDLVDSVVEDMEARYAVNVEQKGHLYAQSIWIGKLVIILTSFVIKSFSWRFFMFKNYLKIAFRNMFKNKMFSFINVIGLAVGMACCLLIVLYISFELSYDNYHKDADRIYRIGIDVNTESFKQTFPGVCFPLAPYLKEHFPQVEKAGRIWPISNVLVKITNNSFYENNFAYVDNEIFEIFSIPFIKGNPETALTNPGSIVISERIGKKYFGSQNPIGQKITVNSNDFLVTAIVVNPPSNTHYKYDLISSLNDPLVAKQIERSWTSTAAYTYLKFISIIDTQDFIAQVMKKVKAGIINSGKNNNYFLQPIKNIHLRSHLAFEMEPPGNPLYLNIFSVVAVIILLIACANFVNLSTVQAAARAKEVGIRKVVGAARKQLIIQFIGESLIITIFSVITALVITLLLLPFLNDLVNTQFTISDLISIKLFVSLLLMIAFFGFIVGSYPAFFFSAVRPVMILKGKLSSGYKGSSIQKLLVVSQFAISIVLIISTTVVFQQLRFMKNQHLGFNKEQKLIIPVRRGASISNNYKTIKSEFLNYSQISGATVSSDVPGRQLMGGNVRLLEKADDKSQWMYFLYVDKDFITEYDLKIIEGRQFINEKVLDNKNEYIINEKAIKSFGWHSPEEAIGKRIFGFHGFEGGIIGVLKDFHFQGLQSEVGPIILTNFPRCRYISLVVSKENISETLAYVNEKWEELFPGIPCEYFFLDTDFDRLYRSEEKIGKLIGVFTIIGLFVACLGLLSLAAFNAQKRTKEIGIRKVLGASIINILSILSKEFILYIAVANLIAFPVAYFVMYKWLQNFAYRVNLGLGIFMLSGLAALTIALLSVGYQTIKAATANPVDSLRYE